MIRFEIEGVIANRPRASQLTTDDARERWERDKGKVGTPKEYVEPRRHGIYSDGNRYTRVRVKTDGIQSETFDITFAEPYASRMMVDRAIGLEVGDRVKITGQFTHSNTHFHARAHKVTVL